MMPQITPSQYLRDAAIAEEILATTDVLQFVNAQIKRYATNWVIATPEHLKILRNELIRFFNKFSWNDNDLTHVLRSLVADTNDETVNHVAMTIYTFWDAREHIIEHFRNDPYGYRWNPEIYTPAQILKTLSKEYTGRNFMCHILSNHHRDHAKFNFHEYNQTQHEVKDFVQSLVDRSPHYGHSRTLYSGMMSALNGEWDAITGRPHIKIALTAESAPLINDCMKMVYLDWDNREEIVKRHVDAIIKRHRDVYPCILEY